MHKINEQNNEEKPMKLFGKELFGKRKTAEKKRKDPDLSPALERFFGVLTEIDFILRRLGTDPEMTVTWPISFHIKGKPPAIAIAEKVGLLTDGDDIIFQLYGLEDLHTIKAQIYEFKEEFERYLAALG